MSKKQKSAPSKLTKKDRAALKRDIRLAEKQTAKKVRLTNKVERTSLHASIARSLASHFECTRSRAHLTADQICEQLRAEQTPSFLGELPSLEREIRKHFPASEPEASLKLSPAEAAMFCHFLVAYLDDKLVGRLDKLNAVG